MANDPESKDLVATWFPIALSVVALFVAVRACEIADDSRADTRAAAKLDKRPSIGLFGYLSPSAGEPPSIHVWNDGAADAIHCRITFIHLKYDPDQHEMRGSIIADPDIVIDRIEPLEHKVVQIPEGGLSDTVAGRYPSHHEVIELRVTYRRESDLRFFGARSFYFRAPDNRWVTESANSLPKDQYAPIIAASRRSKVFDMTTGSDPLYPILEEPERVWPRPSDAVDLEQENPLEAMNTIELLTAALVLITAVYAWLTYRIARSNERSTGIMAKQTALLTRPYVEVGVFLPAKIPMFYLRIRNTGRTAARNLRLAMDRDFFQYGESKGRNLAALTAFREPIASFGPGSELIFALAEGVVLFAESSDPKVTPQEFNVTAAYDYEGGSAHETFHVDLKPYLYSTMEPSPLIEELERMRQAIERTR